MVPEEYMATLLMGVCACGSGNIFRNPRRELIQVHLESTPSNIAPGEM